jgi:hypothetical protein
MTSMFTEIAAKPEMPPLGAAMQVSVAASLANRRLRRLLGFAALAVVAGFSLLPHSGLDVVDESLDASGPHVPSD